MGDLALSIQSAMVSANEWDEDSYVRYYYKGNSVGKCHYFEATRYEDRVDVYECKRTKDGQPITNKSDDGMADAPPTLQLDLNRHAIDTGFIIINAKSDLIKFSILDMLKLQNKDNLDIIYNHLDIVHMPNIEPSTSFAYLPYYLYSTIAEHMINKVFLLCSDGMSNSEILDLFERIVYSRTFPMAALCIEFTKVSEGDKWVQIYHDFILFNIYNNNHTVYMAGHWLQIINERERDLVMLLRVKDDV